MVEAGKQILALQVRITHFGNLTPFIQSFVPMVWCQLSNFYTLLSFKPLNGIKLNHLYNYLFLLGETIIQLGEEKEKKELRSNEEIIAAYVRGT